MIDSEAPLFAADETTFSQLRHLGNTLHLSKQAGEAGEFQNIATFSLIKGNLDLS